jgi:hypothetical protein
MNNPDKEVKDLVDSLIKSSRQDATKKLIDKIEEDEEQTDGEPPKDS